MPRPVGVVNVLAISTVVQDVYKAVNMDKSLFSK